MKRIYLVIAGLLLTASIFAQAPQKMSYQAVIRSSSNTLVTSTPVGMKISVLQGSATGTVVYAETQTPSTNDNGLVSLEIGSGTPVTGTFAGINWAAGPYFIKTETDPTGGTAYSITGTNELMSVPYALYSANSTPGPQGPAGLLSNGTTAGNTPYWDGTSWVTNSSNIFNNGGNIAIGTIGNVSDLVVYGNQGLTRNDGQQTSLQIQNSSIPPKAVRVLFQNDSIVGMTSKWSMVKDYLTQNGGDDLVMEYISTTSIVSTPLVLKGISGNVGIGTSSPQRKLHVNAVMRLTPIASPPSNPAEGDIYMDSVTHKLKVYDGTTWQACW